MRRRNVSIKSHAMSWTFVLRPREMDEFQSCRRAWDFEARVRQNYIPNTPTGPYDFEKAIRVALAVFYFPAMDDWNRSIVRPLAIQGLQRTMREDRAAFEAVATITDEQDRQWHEALALGEVVLNRYLDWAIPKDDFESVLADEDMWVPVADPWHPGLELGTTDLHPIRFLGRIDQLISDADDEYWIVCNRVVTERWTDPLALLADEDALRLQWAAEVSYPQLKVAGTIYNELWLPPELPGAPQDPDAAELAEAEADVGDLRDMTRGVRHVNRRRSPITPLGKGLGLPAPFLDLDDDGLPTPPVSALPATLGVGDRIVAQAGNDFVRRTHLRRSPGSIDRARLDIAEHVLEVRDPAVPVPPNPAPERCSICVYLKPCLMLNDGLDISMVMASDYRKRSEEEFEEEGLRWSSSRRAQRASLGDTSAKPETVNFRWG